MARSLTVSSKGIKLGANENVSSRQIHPCRYSAYACREAVHSSLSARSSCRASLRGPALQLGWDLSDTGPKGCSRTPPNRERFAPCPDCNSHDAEENYYRNEDRWTRSWDSQRRELTRRLVWLGRPRAARTSCRTAGKILNQLRQVFGSESGETSQNADPQSGCGCLNCRTKDLKKAPLIN